MKFKTIIPPTTKTGVENCKSIIISIYLCLNKLQFLNPFVLFPEFITID